MTSCSGFGDPYFICGLKGLGGFLQPTSGVRQVAAVWQPWVVMGGDRVVAVVGWFVQLMICCVCLQHSVCVCI
jgi:hypothetical protein